MTKTFKPMLAATCEDVAAVKYPVLASPKLDGIRCVIHVGRALTRSLKPIPNKAVRAWLESLPLDGCDGELILTGGTFQETTSAVMSPDKPRDPRLVYHVFDFVCDAPFDVRIDAAGHRVAVADDLCVNHVPHVPVAEAAALDYVECEWLAAGFEGVMLRDPNGAYKHGRSTAREGGLLKLKRFTDDEAVVVDVVELQHNGNEKQTNELGRTKRSSAKAGKTPAGTLGTLVVDHPTFGRFEIGTGFTELDRNALWREWHDGRLAGRLAKFKYQAHGVKDKPRCPVFLGFRSPEDL